MRQGVIFCLFFLVNLLPLQAKEVVPLDAFVAAIEKGDKKVWDQFQDFDFVLRQLNWLEKRHYEEAQRPDLSGKKGSVKTIEGLDQLAFLRAYPHLRPAFQRYKVVERFRIDYLMTFSFGWQRRWAYTHKMLALSPRDKGVVGYEKSHFDGDWWREGVNRSAWPVGKLFMVRHYQLLLNLAVCEGYKPAVWDMVKIVRFEKQLTLPPFLSYLLFLRVPKKYLQIIDQDLWQSEIDQRLPEDEQKRYKTLIWDKEKLSQKVRYCSG